MWRSGFSFSAIVLLAVSAGCKRGPEIERAASGHAPTARPPIAAKPAPPKPAPKCPEIPNILLISVDTLRFDATSLDPKGSNPTPRLAKLAARGINFTRCYSTHDSTPPSHFSMLTGLVSGHQSPVDVPEISIVHQLKKRGYRTFGVSANGNLTPKLMRSLSAFGSFVNLIDLWLDLPGDRKQALLPKIDKKLTAYGYKTNDWNRMMVFSSADLVMKYLRPKLRERQPFFGFVNLVECHDPYLPSTRTYQPGGEESATAVPDLRNREVPPELADPKTITDEKRKALVVTTLAKASGRPWSTTFDLDKKQLAVYHRRYRARVREADAAVGEIVDALAENGLLESTIIIVTSDHGEAFGEMNLITHSFFNSGDREVTNRVPLLIVFPPCAGPGGRAVADLVTIADIVPTLYEILGIDIGPIWKKTVPGNVGRSLMPFIRSERTAAAVPADVSGPAVSETDRKKQDAEALKRFRSLGYLQ
jgi:arylsulfatase A-like enzyme